MSRPPLPSFLVALAITAFALPLHAQTPSPNAEQLKSWIAIRQQRVDVLRDDIKQTDARIESRLDMIVNTLKGISDSKDSRTKVARMKEDTQEGLMKTINYYDQKRAALKEELRNPRLKLTTEEKQNMIAIFDARIEKRAQQIMDLHKSMPAHKDYEQYKAVGGGWWGTEYQRNEDYDQNVRMTSYGNSQRDAIVKQLDASIARLDRQGRTLKSQIGATKDPVQRKALTDELTKTEALIAERREQKLDTLNPSTFATHTVALKEAMDLDKAMKSSVSDLRREFTTLFGYYNNFLNELSALHTTEAALPPAKAKS